MLTVGQVALRLGMAALLGGFIGLEREFNRRPAGLRTHILVSLGASLIMLLSAYGFGENSSDPARLAAQVVSGIGFLGAGTILRDGTHVRGLTTAASLWLSGGIGLAVGLGQHEAALIATVLALLSLIVLQTLSRHYADLKKQSQIRVVGIERPGLIGDLGTLLGKYHIIIRQINISNEEADEDKIVVNLSVCLPAKIKASQIYALMKQVEGVKLVEWENIEER